MNISYDLLDALLVKAAGEGRLEAAKLFVGSGADVNAKCKNGHTALIWAAFNGRLEMVKYLVEQGADVNAENSDGEKPLDFTPSNLNPSNHLAIIQYLVNKGATCSIY